MKRQPCGTNGVSEIRIIPYKSTKKLKRGHEVNRSCSEEYKEAIQQETKESSRIEGWRQHVAGKQKYPFEQTLKEVGSKRYGPFKISNDIGLGVFQLKLLEGWMIHNVFNKDLLTKCKELQFKGQHMELASPPTIINKEEEYEVKEV